MLTEWWRLYLSQLDVNQVCGTVLFLITLSLFVYSCVSDPRLVAARKRRQAK